MSVADNPIAVPRDVCRDFNQSSVLEWLDTNHSGAFAMGTVAGVNTRRYHALLIASRNPPVDRLSILSQVEEIVAFSGRDFAIASAQYPGTVTPRGFEFLEEFRIDPFPTWRYDLDGLTLQKTLCLIERKQSVLVRYKASQPCRINVRFMTTFRDYHSLTRTNDALDPAVRLENGSLSFTPYADLPTLTIFHSAGDFAKDQQWFLNREYLRELDRGMDFREDVFSPGVLSFQLEAGVPAWFLATIEPREYHETLDIDQIFAAETQRRIFANPLAKALDQFRVVRHGGEPSLVAGFPWFTDWSRDSLIALPAVQLAGFPASETKEILTMLLDQRSHGILPNRFTDQDGQVEYNTADATLWLFVAADRYLKQTDDRDFLRYVLYPAALDILDWQFRGTFYRIGVDPSDNLLYAGEPGMQLTWMDARVGDWVVTPRIGKPVEINSLWYNALRVFQSWASLLGRSLEEGKTAAQARETLASFNRKFWNQSAGCLYDVLTDSGPDASVRPNQLFAAALPFPLLEKERAQSMVRVVRDALLTPVGVRTLAPSDSAYCPRFQGNPTARDNAYHQGTVWPWLLGPYISAYLFAFGRDSSSLEHCRSLVGHMDGELNACCLGSISEVYDGDNPQRPAGCPAQLWSVAQLIVAHELLADAAFTR